MSNLKQEPIQTQQSFQIFFKNYLSKAYSPKDNQTNFVVNPYFHIASTISIIIHNPTTILNKNPLHFQSTNKKKKKPHLFKLNFLLFSSGLLFPSERGLPSSGCLFCAIITPHHHQQQEQSNNLCCWFYETKTRNNH